MDELDNISPKIFTLSAFLIAFVLIDDMNAAAQNAVGGWFMLLGQTLETNSAQQAYIESKVQRKQININSKRNKSMYNPVFYDIATIKEIMKSTSPDDTYNCVETLERTVSLMQKELQEIKKIISESKN